MFDLITSTPKGLLSIEMLLLVAVEAFILGVAICFAYIQTNKHRRQSQSFIVTIAMLPAIIAVVIMLVGNNVAFSFSLAGTLSIIRFRSSFADPKDITFLLISLTVGLACGAGFLVYAVVFAIIFIVFIVLLSITQFGREKNPKRLLKIVIPEDLDFEGVFDDIFEQFTMDNKLERVRTTDLGSLYELVYTVSLRPGIKTKEFIDMLRCRNGNLNITLILEATLEVS